jgi:ABC-type multidrug transport system ATPase subunit
MQIVEIDSISKAYGDKVAVDKLSLNIAAGTMYGLLGPNGAGKTSSIRMMIGMTLPDSGSVKLFGKPFDRRALEQVGYLPEERGLYKKMNVLAQLVFFGQLHGLSASEATRRAKAWSEKLQISEALPKKTDELSKGMQQKIQFISTLLHEPDLIIMDEPFSGLDPVNATLLEDTLLRLHLPHQRRPRGAARHHARGEAAVSAQPGQLEVRGNGGPGARADGGQRERFLRLRGDRVEGRCGFARAAAVVDAKGEGESV